MRKFRITLLIFLSLFLYACRHHHHHHDDTDEDSPSFQYTVYSEHFELFAEAEAFVVGHTSAIYAHFTSVNNFKPLESGSITLLLKVNGAEYRQTLERPTRAGIYVFELTPEISGTASMHFDIVADEGVYRMDVPVVTVFADEEDARVAAEAVFFPEVNTTIFTKEQSWLVDFATGFPATATFGQVIKTTALVEAIPGAEVTVSANAAGFVQLGADMLLPGKKVTRGQSLMTISAKEMAENNLELRVAEARNNYERAKADYERVRSLASENVLSGRELLAAKNQYENTKAIYEQISKNLNDHGQQVISPQEGYIRRVFVGHGAYVEPGQPVLIITQHNRLMVTAEVPFRHASELAMITTANIRPLHQKEVYSLQQLNGKVLSIGRSANADNHLLPVIFQIENNGRFVAGTFVEAFLQIGMQSGMLAIPNTALIEEQGNYFVWVQLTPELFEKREVKKGVTDGLVTQIVSGITVNDRIVTRGAMMIKLAQATAGLDPHSGHVH